jgi:hypothetical protein
VRIAISVLSFHLLCYLTNPTTAHNEAAKAQVNPLEAVVGYVVGLPADGRVGTDQPSRAQPETKASSSDGEGLVVLAHRCGSPCTWRRNRTAASRCVNVSPSRRVPQIPRCCASQLVHGPQGQLRVELPRALTPGVGRHRDPAVPQGLVFYDPSISWRSTSSAGSPPASVFSSA